MKHSEFRDLLRYQVTPAVGCTEPVAVALCTARAAHEMTEPVKKAEIRVCPSVFKNGRRAGLPGLTVVGLDYATAMGTIETDYTKGLVILNGFTKEQLEMVPSVHDAMEISVDVEHDQGLFYISARLWGETETAFCEIRERHTNITYVEKNGEVVFKAEAPAGQAAANPAAALLKEFKKLTVDDIIDYVESADASEIAFLKEGADMNMAISRAQTPYLAHVHGDKLDDILFRIRTATANASYARLSGVPMPVMSSAGSGNHGITAIIPITILWESLGLPEEILIKSLALSHLMTSYIKTYTGALSPICGCAIAAGVGAAAGMAWMQKMSREVIKGAMTNMIGNLAGMLCDGGKPGCAYKLATAATEAYLSVHLAESERVIACQDGIVGETIEDTIRNLGILCNDGLAHMDDTIIDIMLHC